MGYGMSSGRPVARADGRAGWRAVVVPDHVVAGRTRVHHRLVMTSVRRPVGVMALLLLMVVGACSSGGGSTPASSPSQPHSGVAPSSRSHPFLVSAVPDGFGLITAGRGTQEPTWLGDDTAGPTRRFTVLAPSKPDAASLGGVTVFAMGYYRDGEGLDALGPSYSGISTRPLRVDGHDARYSASEAGSRPSASALALGRGSDVAVVVDGDHATRQELVDVARATKVPTDRRQAPTVPDPPLGLRVVGSVDADAALAFDSYLVPGSGARPGTPAAHVVGWQRGSIDLVAMSMPGSSIDLDAFAARPDALGYGSRRQVHRREIHGVPALVIEEGDGATDRPAPRRRTVLAVASTGDVLLATAAPGVAGNPDHTAPPSVEQMVALVASMAPTVQARWDAFVEQASGGAGFHADPGQTELSSGERNGIAWLLQDGPGPAANGVIGVSGSSGGPVIRRDISACLKLDNGDRPCATSSSGGGTAPVTFISSSPTSAVGPFVVLETDVPGDRLRVVSSAGTTEAALTTGVDTDRRAAVLFLDQPGPPVLTCASPPPPGSWLVSAIAADGSVTCLGRPNG